MRQARAKLAKVGIQDALLICVCSFFGWKSCFLFLFFFSDLLGAFMNKQFEFGVCALGFLGAWWFPGCFGSVFRVQTGGLNTILFWALEYHTLILFS